MFRGYLISIAVHEIHRLAYQCTVCIDMFRSHEIVRLDLRHSYCPDCLKELFVRASSDMALFPPHCCRVKIPVSLVSGDISSQDMENLADTTIEIETAKRTCCNNTQCGKFIPPANIDADTTNCGRSEIVTCDHCRGQQHEGECTQYEALQSTLALATTRDWRHCHTCHAIVELNHGCYQITYVVMIRRLYSRFSDQGRYLCSLSWHRGAHQSSCHIAFKISIYTNVCS